jgi:hypothetical protein
MVYICKLSNKFDLNQAIHVSHTYDILKTVSSKSVPYNETVSDFYAHLVAIKYKNWLTQLILTKVNLLKQVMHAIINLI